jgi:hypothetical protein
MPAELTTKEAANRKGVTPSAVTSAIREGRLKARIERKPGAARGTWRVDAAALDAWEPMTDPGERARHAQARRWEPESEGPRARQLAAIEAGFGMFAKGATPTEAFLKERNEEAEREEARGWKG